jgi:hypothetical protein
MKLCAIRRVGTVYIELTVNYVTHIKGEKKVHSVWKF